MMKKIMSFTEFNILESNVNSFTDFLNEAEFKHINKDEHKIKLAIKDVEKKSKLKANRDKPLEYEQLSLNKIMLSKVLGRGKLDKEHQDAWKKLKKEYDLKESVNEAKEKWVVYDTKTKKRLPNAGKTWATMKAADEFAAKQKNAEVASDTWYFDKIQESVNEAKKLDIGDKGVDYNDNIVEIIAMGNYNKIAKMLKKETGNDPEDYGYEKAPGNYYLTKNIEATEGNVGDIFMYPVKYDTANYWGLNPVKESVNEGLSSSDIKSATSAIKKYVNKLGKKANGAADEVATKIAKLLKWPDTKIESLTDYLIKINSGSEEIIFETIGTVTAPIYGEQPEEYPEIALEKDNKYIKEIVLLLKELYMSALDSGCDAVKLKETLIPKYKNTKYKINITEDGDFRLDSFGKYPDVHINLNNMKKGNHDKSSIKEEIRSQIKKLNERLPGIPSISQISSFSSAPNLPV